MARYIFFLTYFKLQSGRNILAMSNCYDFVVKSLLKIITGQHFMW